MQAIVKFPVAMLLAVLLAVIIALVLAAPSVLAKDAEPAPHDTAPVGSVSAGARLAELDLHGIGLEPRFDPDQADYQGYMHSREMGSTTVTATAENADATVAISPADADADVAGHQVDLTAGEDVSVEVTVTSSDGTSESVYVVAMKYGDGFVKLDVGRDIACAIRHDSTVECWPDVSDPLHLYQDVAAGAVDRHAHGSNKKRDWHACGVRFDGTMHCWGDLSSADTEVQAVAMWLYGPCWVKTDGSIRRDGQYLPDIDAQTGTGPYQSVTTGYGLACALTPDNLVECVNWWGRPLEHSEPETEFKHIISGGEVFCGIRMDETLMCWRWDPFGYSSRPSAISTPEGEFKSVAASRWFVCAVKSDDGSIVCFKHRSPSGKNKPRIKKVLDDVPEGEFQSVGAGEFFACGLKTDDSIVCWGGSMNSRQPSAPPMVSPRASDARLASLKIQDAEANGVALTPKFKRDTLGGYLAEVPAETPSVTVMPGPPSRFAEVIITPPDADPDTVGHQVALDVGTNSVSVTVTSWDDSAEKTYTLEIIRREQRTYNAAPAFDTLYRSVAENSAADTPVGPPVVASDPDADPVTYSLRGADAASFRIDASTGQIYTVDGVDYDYETKPTYSVTARADDGYGPSATARVVISLTDELESEQQNSDGLSSRQWDSVDVTHPKRPRGLTASPEAGSVRLSWSQPKEDAGGVTDYMVLRRVEGFEDCGLWSVEGTGNADTTWTDAGVVAGASYTYQVRALRGTEMSGGSNYQTVEAGAVAIAEPPGAPAGLTAVGTGETRIDLSWQAPVGGPTGYEVEWSADGVAGWAAVDPAHVGTDTSYGHAGLTARTEHFYRVRAVNAAGAGEWSSLASTTTPAAPNTPATGQPTISGTAQVGETLTADTSGIADADGLHNAVLAHQWVADGSAIQDATDSTYTLVDDDAGRAISVTVSFTDDAGNAETLTSAATVAVEARPNVFWSDTLTVGENDAGAVGYSLWDNRLGHLTDPDFTADSELNQVRALGHQDGTLLMVLDKRLHWEFVLRIGDREYTGGNNGADTIAGHEYQWEVADSPMSAGETITVSLTGIAPLPNRPATGQPTISGTIRVGETLTADTSSISDDDGLNHAVFSYQWQSDGADIAGATAYRYTLTDADEGRAISVRVSFTDDRGHSETLTSAATAAVAGPPSEPLTASFSNGPSSHDGENTFTFELHFGEELSVSYKRLRDDAFEVTGGTVRKAQRLEPGSNAGWRITVQPDGNGAVTIVLPETTDCDDHGAICTGDGRMLSNRSELTVSGP